MKKLRTITEEFEEELSNRGQNHLKSLNNTLTNHYSNEKYNDGNNSHIEKLKHYTRGTHINYALWDHHIGKFINKDDKHYINRMDQALNHIKTPRSFNVYSNTRHDPRVLQNAEGIVHHPAYLSTSINPQYVKHWCNTDANTDNKKIIRHILKIRVPKNHPGSYVGSHISAVPDQHEFILPRGMNLKYKGTKTETSPRKIFGRIQEHHIHEMEIV